eukprot:gb/GEZN01005093.1/.p1 GENE.gb/GEZN01005093.1/~~gb/GEZN01005093.1/.p1  ORF type:complete len:516 (+),score=10.12 gb/GEZN01005093.1/:133-1680(+)
MPTATETQDLPTFKSKPIAEGVSPTMQPSRKSRISHASADLNGLQYGGMLLTKVHASNMSTSNVLQADSSMHGKDWVSAKELSASTRTTSGAVMRKHETTISREESFDAEAGLVVNLSEAHLIDGSPATKEAHHDDNTEPERNSKATTLAGLTLTIPSSEDISSFESMRGVAGPGPFDSEATGTSRAMPASPSWQIESPPSTSKYSVPVSTCADTSSPQHMNFKFLALLKAPGEGQRSIEDQWKLATEVAAFQQALVEHETQCQSTEFATSPQRAARQSSTPQAKSFSRIGTRVGSQRLVLSPSSSRQLRTRASSTLIQWRSSASVTEVEHVDHLKVVATVATRMLNREVFNLKPSYSLIHALEDASVVDSPKIREKLLRRINRSLDIAEPLTFENAQASGEQSTGGIASVAGSPPHSHVSDVFTFENVERIEDKAVAVSTAAADHMHDFPPPGLIEKAKAEPRIQVNMSSRIGIPSRWCLWKRRALNCSIISSKASLGRPREHKLNCDSLRVGT